MVEDNIQLHRWTFYYDGKCRFCSPIASGLRQIDLFNKISWTPFQHLSHPPGGLSWRDLDNSAYLEVRPNDLRPGFKALKYLVIRLPLLFPIIPIIWALDKSHTGAAIYCWVSKNRRRLFQCRTIDHSDL
ncbi:DUF393 domain-containing protein [SAR202 cluster bacterium AD-804-J14_MRT_500m]|nr:DUF393 domain-containing protein [SAR202 cluster bacterium AD-804-J14_MRT_500m]